MKPQHDFSATQVRMARAGLNWSIEYLAHRAGLKAEVLALFEQGAVLLSDADREELGRALYHAIKPDNGVRPIASRTAGEGVRFRKPRRQKGRRIPH